MRRAVILRSALLGLLAFLAVTAIAAAAAQAAHCPAERPEPLGPTDPAMCRQLLAAVRTPSAHSPADYQDILARFILNFCHRDTAAGWVRDKRVRDTGPYISRLQDDDWQGSYYGTHSPVVIWYSPDAAAWVRAHRGPGAETPQDGAPMPDGAILLKEMYPAPAERCAGVDPLHLRPTSGVALMVRDSKAAFDGWYWGWFGWSGWKPDFPADNLNNPPPNMGFGQYCVNCHASARDNGVFAALRNMQGEAGSPLAYLIQDRTARDAPLVAGRHRALNQSVDKVLRLGTPRQYYDSDFLAAFPHTPAGTEMPDWDGISRMPSAAYDNVWMPAGPPDGHGQFLTSDQCASCHSAGSTGLQFDMTLPAPNENKLLNLSPYATWTSSPMGLAGRDPIFFAQLASETQSFHPDNAAFVADTCLGCHGVMGERQFDIDRVLAGKECGEFTRDLVGALPWPSDNPLAAMADYGALARDGVSCTVCHHMAQGKAATDSAAATPQNRCALERQQKLNPGLTGFAATFTGSFLVGPSDRMGGPFEAPKTLPMERALGIRPEHDAALRNSETCGTCHTVHLPVLRDGRTLAQVYEQTTYPEWAFSDYRTGLSADGPLPGGAGARAQSCQGCHMSSIGPDGKLLRSRIASIQQYSNFPQADFTLPPEAIDLPVREGFARHTLVGLNLFLTGIAGQFPEILGIGIVDEMLGNFGRPPLQVTEDAMLTQAEDATARVSVTRIAQHDGILQAEVHVENLAGHRLPTGVGFRRVFLTFEVLDQNGTALWASGRTDTVGRLVDPAGRPLAGEVWWEGDCSARIAPLERRHQPHFQTISRQDQAQIYQELVAAPPRAEPAGAEPAGAAPACGQGASPAGPLTTSFLSLCAGVKDNRLLPHGMLPLAQRQEIAKALGAGPDLAAYIVAEAVGDDPDYRQGGGDTLTYTVPLAEIDGRPASVRARLFYQATPPFYLQDRFCTARGADRDRLYFLAGHLNVEGTPIDDWKLAIGDSGPVPLQR